MLTYEQSGVNIDEGNRAVSLIKNKIKETYDKNVIGDLGNFSGLYSLKDFLFICYNLFIGAIVCLIR